MRPEDLQVALRPRTGMEAIALGMTLARTHAGALWSVWLGFVLPLSLLLNLVLVPLDKAWLAGLLLWWLKPMGERAVLELLARATFGQQLSRGKALRIAWLPDALLWPYLLWRRFGLARSLLMPADRLEGAPPARRRQRRSQLLRDDGPTGFLCTWLFSWLEIILMLGLVSLAGLMVPAEMLGDTLRDAWETLRNSEGSSRGLGVNLLLTVAIAITGPFYVACGFALYINRRTRSEGWDLELGLRRLARRLAQTLPGLAAAGLALLLGAALLPATARASQVTTTTAGPAPGAAAASRLGDGLDQADTAPARGSRQERPVPELPVSNAGGSTWQQAAQRRQQDSRTPTPAPPTPAQRLSTATEQAYRQPELGAVRQRQVHDPAEQERDEKTRERLEKLEAWLKGSWLAHLGQAVRVLLWVMAIALLGLLLWYARRWLGWRVERDDAPPAQEQHPAVIAEPLPAHPAAQARALWQAGQQRAALSLLYRASVAALERQLPQPLPDGATEAQCLAAAAHLPQQPDRELFATLVRTWQRAAYAGQLPDNAGFAHLVDALTQRRGWL